MTTSKTSFRFVGRHIDDLADGRTIEPGQFVDLTQAEIDDPHNAQRISEGLLVEVDKPKTSAKGEN